MNPAARQRALSLPFIVLTIGVFAVSTGAIFARLAAAPPLVIAAYRMAIATAVVLPICLWKHSHQLRRIRGQDARMATAAGFFLALHFATWITSLNYTSVANSVVLVNTIPLWVALLTPVLTRERLGRQTLIAVFLSFLGGAIVGIDDFSTAPGQLWGDTLALVGGICAAVYLLLGRNLRARLGLFPYISLCYGTSALLLWSVVFILALPYTDFNVQTFAAMVGMGIVSQVIGHSSFNWALRWFSAALMAATLLGEPILSSLWAFLLFSESLSWWQALGSALILAGIYLAARSER